jgi:hypothetical protein
VTSTVLRVAMWMPAEMRRLKGLGSRDCIRLRVACECEGRGGGVADSRTNKTVSDTLCDYSGFILSWASCGVARTVTSTVLRVAR